MSSSFGGDVGGVKLGDAWRCSFVDGDRLDAGELSGSDLRERLTRCDRVEDNVDGSREDAGLASVRTALHSVCTRVNKLATRGD